jgi:hypothetical protein
MVLYLDRAGDAAAERRYTWQIRGPCLSRNKHTLVSPGSTGFREGIGKSLWFNDQIKKYLTLRGLLKRSDSIKKIIPRT